MNDTYRVGKDQDFLYKKIRFFWFKSDFFDLNQIFLYKQVTEGDDR